MTASLWPDKTGTVQPEGASTEKILQSGMCLSQRTVRRLQLERLSQVLPRTHLIVRSFEAATSQADDSDQAMALTSA